MSAAATDRSIKLLTKKILVALNERNAALDIFLLPHAEIKALKAQFIKKQTEPNVLAFPEPRAFPHPELQPRRGARSSRGDAKQAYLGEIYLNRDILRRSPARAAPLLLHGILHLLGYDHKREVDAEKMEMLEERILKKL